MQMSKATRRVVGALLSTAVGAGALIAATPMAQADSSLLSGLGLVAPPPPEVGFIAQADGTYAYTENGMYKHGPSAFTTIACTSETGLERSANAAAVDLPQGLGEVGATENHVSTVEEADGAKSAVSTTETAGASVLGGLVSFSAITSKAVASHDGTDYVAGHESKIADLEIAGKEIDAEVGPNTTFDLNIPAVGSIGKIELNKQEEQWIGDEFKVNTTAIHISILEDVDKLGLISGTHVFIGQSRSSLLKPHPGYLAGDAYATKLTVNAGKNEEPLVSHGPTSYSALKCLGGESGNTMSTGDVKELADAGAAESMATGSVSESESKGTTAVRIAGASVLDGLVSAEAIKAQANASRTADGTLEVSDTGSKLANVTIAGKEIDANVGPNTTIDVAGLGQVTLHKVSESETGITVTMIEVVIGVDNLPYPIGTKLEIGTARAEVRP
jgi:hypothetical protein